ncbi:HupV protein [Parasulfuritortus cantonensis]|uniref:HupV protein n=1 Tax=Parasulfuritortus cantonensis TaxID=2528202 RepID=A0A4R1BIT2_9PROT|nr:nickel-dependent hydrogenase large subunit [Parasulfuritortus cantonensis]TCJ17189.1 HupV protein [Parasulfuritortus cantonensis]
MTRERRIVGPFNRVEGDLEVRLDIEDERIAAASISASLYRGFEAMLPGRPSEDALTIVPRICGICSVSQSIAAAAALRNLAGAAATRNGLLAECLVGACENLADHLTHFYLFFMPDFARPAYAGRPWYDEAAARFRAVEGTAARDVLPARAAFMHLMGLMAGKWPHTLSLRPGGSARPLAAGDVLQLVGLVRDFRRFLEQHLFGDRLEAVTGLAGLDDLARWRRAGGGDLRRFLAIADDLGLDRAGRAGDRFLSYGAYAGPDGRLWPAGVWRDGRVAGLDVEAVSEDVSHAWLEGGTLPPLLGRTVPDPDKPGAYTWCKAPRYRGEVVETGALARQMVAGQPLVRALVAERGGSVTARVLARLLELAAVVPVMEDWARAIEPGAPWCDALALPDDGEAVGLAEAARGSLGHWLVVRQGRIARYQVVAPTTWNFSPRDGAGTPGALEQALAGLAVPGGDLTPVQHVVRSFDPCMACTVH